MESIINIKDIDDCMTRNNKEYWLGEDVAVIESKRVLNQYIRKHYLRLIDHTLDEIIDPEYWNNKENYLDTEYRLLLKYFVEFEHLFYIDEEKEAYFNGIYNTTY